MRKLLISLSVLFMLFLNGCTTKTLNLHSGEGETLAQLKQACDKNDGKRCVALGIRYQGDFTFNHPQLYDTKIDYQKAKKYFEKACRLNVAEGCYNLGRLLDIHLKRELLSREHGHEEYKKNDELAQMYIDKGCKMGAAGKCDKIYGRYYPGGKSKGMSIAIPYDENPNNIVTFKKACEKNDSGACVKVGRIYFRGLDIKKDLNEAEKYFKKACDLNNGFGCYNLTGLSQEGKGKWGGPDWSEYQKACDLGIITMCEFIERQKKEK